MLNRLIPGLLAAALLVSAPLPAAADTVLRLAESATVMVPPDEIAASLRFEIIAPTAADAQSRVNAAMKDALAAAAQAKDVVASTGGYSVWRSGPSPQDKTEKWQATQTLNLTSTKAEALLPLVGALQAKGAALNNMGWRLSTEAQRKAQQEATHKAIAGLRARVDDAAKLLGMKFDRFREVRLDGVEPPQMPRPVMAMAAPRVDSAPPVVAAQDVAVSATVQADAALISY